MISTKVICDHCGTQNCNKLWKASFVTLGEEIEDLYACTKEHLGLAIAARFGIATEAAAARLIAEANERLSRAVTNLTSEQTAPITDTTKPTKPIAATCDNCGQPNGPLGCWCDMRSF